MARKQNDLLSFPVHTSPEVENLFEKIIQRPWSFCREARGWEPSIDLYEGEDCFLLEADLPGVKREDVQVEISDGDLVLRGSRVIVQTRSDGRFRAMERRAGHFVRRITLPEKVDPERIQAEFSDGVLRVNIPKLGGPQAGEK